MAKATKIVGVHSSTPLYKAMPKVATIRLKELEQWADAIDSGDGIRLHQMRIAAKRLRYALEVVVSAYGNRLKMIAKRVKELQDVLGQLHDTDVLQAFFEHQITEMQQPDAETLMAERVAHPLALSGGDKHLPRVDRVDGLAPADLIVGLEGVIAQLCDRRDRLHKQAKQVWQIWQDENFSREVQKCLKTK